MISNVIHKVPVTNLNYPGFFKKENPNIPPEAYPRHALSPPNEKNSDS